MKTRWIAWTRSASLWLLVLLCIVLSPTARAQTDPAPDSGATAPEVITVRTENPRQTFETFRRLSAEMEAELLDYLSAPTLAGVSRLALLSDQMNSLIDLSAVPAASRRETGIRTMSHLMDIFGRIPPIDPGDIPDTEAMDAEGVTSTRIPGTPIYIAQITDADRFGEFLFVGSTVDVAPRFYRSVRDLPMRTELPVQSLSSLGPQLTGPLIPPRLVAAMPPGLRALWLDTPVWKVIAMVLVAGAVAVFVVGVHRITGRSRSSSRSTRLFLQTVTPLAILAIVKLLLPFFVLQLNPSGRFADVVATTSTVASYLAYAWLFWVSIRLAFEWIILSPRIPDSSLDANLLRLVSNILGIIGTVVILAFGGQEIGLPILSILAGLGIGGLAMALALQPTLENLVGGVILYLDRPVRVGDFCKFGDQMGTIEAIGVRSTRLRALDRTIITVPNAQFADLQIVNFAYCDSMLVLTTLGVRYETTPDQLRHLLAKMRAMLHAHPRVDRETVRVRFAGFADSALNIELRVYIKTREWNDFFAVREDILLRVFDLVEASGTGFAFPSQTVYLGRDKGVDGDRARAAEQVVQDWRRRGNLPFPRYSPEEIDAFEGTLDYPPRGSVVAEGSGEPPAEQSASDERLSADDPTDLDEDGDDGERRRD